MDVTGPSHEIPAETCTPEPLSCPHCLLSYGDFSHIYTDNLKGLVLYVQTHGLFLGEKVCPECKCVALICRKKDFVVFIEVILGTGGVGGKASHLKGGWGVKPQFRMYFAVFEQG